MAQTRKRCKDCDAPIGFIQDDQNGRWIPVDPETEVRHRCDLPQTCGTCSKEFRGAPWMDKCPECFRSGRSSPDRPPAAPRPSRPPEPLQGDLVDDDDAPPF